MFISYLTPGDGIAALMPLVSTIHTARLGAECYVVCLSSFVYQGVNVTVDKHHESKSCKEWYCKSHSKFLCYQKPVKKNIH